MATTFRLGSMLGDGIGPEIVPAGQRVVDAAIDAVGANPVDWVELPMGATALAEYGTPMPQVTKDALRDTHGWVIGPHDSESYGAEWKARGERPPGGELRHSFELYANIRPSRNRPGVPSLVSGVDIVTVRENTEGFYADRNMVRGSGEFMPSEDVALVVGVFTRRAIERIARTAFELASTRRKKVVAVHKGNVVPMAFGLMLDVCREVGSEFPGVEFSDCLFDAMTAHLVRHPQDYDVIVTENMFGDVLSDLTGELVGSLGLSASLNCSETHAMSQAAHGSAPDIAGQGKANPIGLILSNAMLLDWLGQRHESPQLVDAARRIDAAIDRVLADGPRTPDMGGSATTDEFTGAVVEAVGSEAG
ncbi:MAG: isocitrate/isopropylmalate family dehydrogenase [Nocardioides sp.]